MSAAPAPTLSAAPAATPEGNRIPLPEPLVGQTLLTLPYFAGCSPADVKDSISGIWALECGPSSVLMSAGAAGGGLGLLISGTAKLTMGAPGEEGVAEEQLKAPEVFGEIALFGGGEQPCSVIAVESCRVLWLTPVVASKLLGRLPRFSAALAARMAARFRTLATPPPLALTEVEPEFEGPPPTPSVPPALYDPSVIRFVELSDFELTPNVLKMLPSRLIKQYRVIPVKLSGKKLTVAMVAPKHAGAVAEITRMHQALDLEIVAIAADDYNATINKLKLDEAPTTGSRAVQKLNTIDPNQLVLEAADFERDAGPPPKTVGDDVIRIVNRIVAAALEREASDIHLEPVSTGMRVRFRVSGVLQDWNEPVPATHARGVIARFKVLGGADITERRRPQDGRIGVKLGARSLDMRLSTMPARSGEKVVLRVLDSGASSRPLGQLFVDPRIVTMARKSLNRPYGGIIVAGATGSGKTSTLYAMLNERRQTRPETHTVMVEDPIEFRLEGTTQVQVDHTAGLAFATVLRSMLRQDPDVIVVGEMRDTETAKIGLEAAMTGHLLLTTLHANGAVSAIERLEQLGCGRPLIGQAMALFLVQRLVRKLCPACRVTETVPQPILDSLVAKRILAKGANPALPSSPGCDACNRTGYAGRVAVIEAMQITSEVRDLIAAGEPHGEIEAVARKTGALIGFNASAGFLLEQGLIGPSDALLAVAD
jgi:type IV pilus assembly protein PilB